MAKKISGKSAARPFLVLSPEECREIDRRCAADFGLPTLILMENAAVQVAGSVLEIVKGLRSPRVLVFAGTGNNGGDGLGAARHLANAGCKVAVVLVGDRKKLTGDAAVQLKICEGMRLPIFDGARAVRSEAQMALRELGGAETPPEVVLDALFGTGLSRPITGSAEAAVACMNDLRDWGAKVVAVDIPSGLDATNGEIHGVAVRADLTVTFVGVKSGMLIGAAPDCVGELVVADIGVPRMLIEKIVESGNSRKARGVGRKSGKVKALRASRAGGRTRRGS